MRQGEIKFNFGNLFLSLHQESKIANAEKNEGESELRDALLSKAEYLTKIGMKEEAVEAIRLNAFLLLKPTPGPLTSAKSYYRRS